MNDASQLVRLIVYKFAKIQLKNYNFKWWIVTLHNLVCFENINFEVEKMSHLFTMRKGWQSEHLAKFILSQIAFIANPSLIADDIGSDFICTLFQIIEKKSKDYLIPKNSFAIQIKSNLRKIDLSKKIGYLAELEVPYFVGIINKSKLTLTIYSGEYFPQFIFPNVFFSW